MQTTPKSRPAKDSERIPQPILVADDNDGSAPQLHQRDSFHSIVSRNPRMHEIFELVGTLAHTKTTVLIEGETGTGKEALARAIHQASDRRNCPLVAVNCAALPESLLESELFG